MLSAKLGCETADVGLPIWAMHSAAETLGAHDLLPSAKIFEQFFNPSI